MKARPLWRGEIITPVAADLAVNITVYPTGRSLPEGFVQQDWAASQGSGAPSILCLTNRVATCDAFLVDLDGDGKDEIVLMNHNAFGRAVAFGEASDGSWHAVGLLSWQTQCKGVREALLAGHFTLVDSVWKDVAVNGQRLRLEVTGKCP